MRRDILETVAVTLMWLAIFSAMPQAYTQVQRWLCFCGYDCGPFPLANLLAAIFTTLVGIGSTITAAIWVVSIWEDK